MYHFIVVGWNCEKFVDECIDSILKQDNKISFDIHVLDDASTDSTYTKLLKYKNKKNVFIYRNSVNKGAAYSRYRLITNKNFLKDDVLILVDMDDYLLEGSLNYINSIYENNSEVELTYGNWISDAGRKLHIMKYYSDDVFINKNFEDCGGGVPTHLRTFKVKLLKNISPIYFKIDGEWIKNATDVALMFFVLKNTKNKNSIKVIEKPLYFYRRSNNNNLTIKRFSKKNKIEISRKIKKILKINFKK